MGLFYLQWFSMKPKNYLYFCLFISILNTVGQFFNQPIVISEEEDYLKVVGQGERTDFATVMANAEKVHTAIQQSKKELVLLDITHALFKMPHADAFNLLKVFELKLIGFRKVKMAIIINPRTEELGDFWVSICKRRGFDFGKFKNEADARTWLFPEN